MKVRNLFSAFLFSFFLLLTACEGRNLFTGTPTDPNLLSITYPANGSTVIPPFVLSGSFGTNISTVMVLWGADFAAADIGGQNYALYFSSANVSNGLNTFTVYGRDASGYLVATNTVSVIVGTDDGLYDYYSTAFGKSGDALKAALHEIVDDHIVFPYTDSSTDVWDALKVLDEDPSDSANVWLIYKQTGLLKSLQDTGGDVDNWNREHTWPKSYGFPDEEDSPAYTDFFHLRPADASVNTALNNRFYDNGGSQHSEATLCYYDTDSWEAPDAVKGDIARGLFYMVVRYEGDTGDGVDLELTDTTSEIQTTTGGTAYMGKLSTLIEWHLNDPVDSNEIERNNTIYSDFQSNRNPFIDHPEWVTNIWN